VEQLPGQEITVIEFLDARGADGKVRKYRAMMIDGQIYPLHVAISSQWKIHYFTAEMAERADHRAEDAEFLENMAGVLGERAMEGWRGFKSTLGLDYAGIDFGLSAGGDVLLFEANATMVVNPPEADERWAYRRPAVERIFAAVRRMLTLTLRLAWYQSICLCASFSTYSHRVAREAWTSDSFQDKFSSMGVFSVSIVPTRTLGRKMLSR
jgi:hypothetical protein